MNIFIILFILILNIVNIFAIYKLLGETIPKKDKIIFIAVGVAIMYVLVSGVYWLSGLGINSDASEAGRDFITFTFVPVNGLCVLTFLSTSYKKYRDGVLKADKLKNRCIVLIVVLAILLFGEYFYFKNIQKNAVEILNSNLNNTTNEIANEVNSNIQNETTTNNNFITNENSNILNNEENNVNTNSPINNGTISNNTVSNDISNNSNEITDNVTTNSMEAGVNE